MNERVISSQQGIVAEIVKQKMIALADEQSVVLPVWAVGDIEGFGELYILCDGHHRQRAAEELGIAIEYEVVDQPEQLSGIALLESAQDGSWYYVESGKAL